MKKHLLKPLVWVGCLIGLTCAALSYSGRGTATGNGQPMIQTKSGILSVSGQLVQNKVVSGGDGSVAMSLTLTSDVLPETDAGDSRHADIVIVLDRSGSMQGSKLESARQAALNLLSQLSAQDRFGLVAYSDGVQRYSHLVNVTESERERLSAMIRSIRADGSTNLGGGLQEGINVLLSAKKTGNRGKVILISDGLANRGMTDPMSLGAMAAAAAEKAFAVSTVGVGADFNEHLMTAIADRGTGNYYYLDNPAAFAEVFQKEFHRSKLAAATAVEVRIPLSDGVSLISASGYPIENQNGVAVFRPGDVLSGQSRNLFLTFNVPTHTEQVFQISGLQVQYQYGGETYRAALSDPFQIACIKDPNEVIASVDKRQWEQKVIQDDYNRLKEEVAADIKIGNEQAAIGRIQQYEAEKQALNSAIKSDEVSRNLEKDVQSLRQTVQETFEGSPEEIQSKQVPAAKSLQFEGYKGRRSQ